MKGIIFSVFSRYVENKFDLITWDSLLEENSPSSKGIYSSTKTYDDKEMIDLITTLSKLKSISMDYIFIEFGKYMIQETAKHYPDFYSPKDLKTFLLSIHEIIHVEVKKLYIDATPPEFKYEVIQEDKLVMLYKSKRQLCKLAEGLLEGASIYYKTPIQINKTECCKKGANHCRFEIIFKQ